jgi:hypothetical protein
MKLITCNAVHKYMVLAYSERDTITTPVVGFAGGIRVQASADQRIKGSTPFELTLRLDDREWRSAIEKARAEAERAAV